MLSKQTLSEETTPTSSAAGSAQMLSDGAEVAIRAPMQAVWDYAGDSARATDWSVYFHHISPKASDAQGRPLPPDGTVGSVRVCYRRGDETGVRWDERVMALEPEGRARHRCIRTYDLRGLGGVAGALAPFTAYRVEQHYRQTAPQRTTLAFRTQLVRPDWWGLARLLFRRFFLPEVKRIFALNLENIKAAVEAEQAGRAYERPHPYEERHAWE